MNEPLALAVAIVAGAAIGMFFFGGLWWTVRRGLSSPWPAVWFLGSLLLRSAVTLSGFYFMSQGDWRRLLLCLFGFLLARILVIRFTRTPVKPHDSLSQGARSWI